MNGQADGRHQGGVGPSSSPDLAATTRGRGGTEAVAGVATGSDLFGLPVGWTAAWIFNCYVIGDPDDSLVVVDPGLPLVARQALALIEGEMGRRAGDVTAIMCTHGHPDHVGGVSTLTEAADAEVHLPALCREYLAGGRPRNFALLDATLRFMALYREQAFSRRALADFARVGRTTGFSSAAPTMTLDFTPAGFLDDGTDMPGAPGWRAIHAPGHTDDSTCLYHEESATLISGDAVVTQDGHAWFNPEYVDLDRSRETEERLRSLEVRHLLPGHGRPLVADDVWAGARSASDPPTGPSLLARCSRRLGRWPPAG